jgi:hypothetical protein
MTEKTYLLTVSKNFSRSMDEVWEWLEKNLGVQLEKKTGFEKIEYILNKNEGLIEFKGRTVKGTVSVKEDLLKISVYLPLLYRAFIPQIRAAVQAVFKEL